MKYLAHEITGLPLLRIVSALPIIGAVVYVVVRLSEIVPS